MATENAISSKRKIAVVTGGSRGLGRSTVLDLAKRGVDTIFTYNANREAADQVIAAVRELGGTSHALQLDTGKTRTFEAFVVDIRKTLGLLGAERFDFLVNNAGISHHAPFDKVTEDEMDALYNVVFKGVFFLTQRLLPLINDGGKIITVSSALTRVAFPGSAAYASMKGAIEVLSRYMAKELGTRHITVNTVAPGAIATDFSSGMVRDKPEINKQIADMTALGRAGLPDDIGPMIGSLLSEENRWVNAQRIEVSGGAAI